MYQIVSDSSCDLEREIVEQTGLEVVPFYVSMDGETFLKENEEMDIREMYQYMVDHKDVFPKTSLPSTQDYIEKFEPYLKKGIDILCICISTKFSGSYNSAMNAKEILLEEYENARIEVIDATVNTVLQGIFVEEALRLQAEGKEFSELVSILENIKSTGRIFFTVGSMDYLIHGGRVGKLKGIAAGKLGIKPLILLKEGEIFPNGLVRRRDKSLDKILAQTIEYMKENEYTPSACRITLGYGYDKEEGEALRERLENTLCETFGEAHVEVECHQIGVTIGVHTGPYAIGIGIIKKG